MTETRRTPFEEAFRDVTGKTPTPQAVAEAMKNPKIKKAIDDQVQAIEDLRGEEDDEE